MDHLQVQKVESNWVKERALEDARLTQASINEAAKKADKAPPKYVLTELIGKGSFGRVYMGKDVVTAGIVAVKMINIDESDTVSPRNAESYNEFLKEVSALKLMSENKARNINHIIDALLVGHTVWIVTEYCGGGSVATLMKPTPKGLQEKWIVPILREVAEALKWVHQAGIIHRDVKCANVLITERGGLQLCDFGVAGITETKLDKRSTFIGTPHWMAPELFASTRSYGKEVDIWALGSMAYEIATGLPPNAANGISSENLRMHFKNHIPRLEGGGYSTELRSFVACCLEELPSSRPTIDQIQLHPYIHNTDSKHPTSTLSQLVRAFKLWEYQGGSRKSLFMYGSSEGSSEVLSSQPDDEWNFSTTAAFDQEVSRESTAQDVYEAYSTMVDLEPSSTKSFLRPSLQYRKRDPRRRPAPKVQAPLQAPLEKIFDPNTVSDYDDNSRKHYGHSSTSDLPLRDNLALVSLRDTMVDLGSDEQSETDQSTIKAGRQVKDDGVNVNAFGLPDFRRPALSEPIEVDNNRRTQDWKFPSVVSPTSADPDSNDHPALVHHPTEPIDNGFEGGLVPFQEAKDRFSVAHSLIDLDMSLPDYIPEIIRPSTASSEGSAISEQKTPGNPFELEHHTSLYQLNRGNKNLANVSNVSISDTESEALYPVPPSGAGKDQDSGVSDSKYISMPLSQGVSRRASVRRPDQSYTIEYIPNIVAPPSLAAMTGTASEAEVSNEMLRLLSGLIDQFRAFQDVYKSL